MATKIVMEALSPTMEEGRLVEWKKKEGDPVAVGDVLADVETDKAVMELVARASGVLLKQLVSAGATVPVSEPIGWIGAAGETVEGAQTPKVAATKPEASKAEEPKAEACERSVPRAVWSVSRRLSMSASTSKSPSSREATAGRRVKPTGPYVPWPSPG